MNDGPALLPPLVRGQQIRHGPYNLTVTDEMVAEVQRENERRRRAWDERRRRQQQIADEYYGDFKDFRIRRRFIRRVFSILALQLIFTAAVCATFMISPEAKEFMLKHYEVQLLAIFVFIFTYLMVVCTDYARRQAPCNIISLFFLTISMAYMAAFSCIRYKIEWVTIVATITAGVVTLIWAIATCTKFDLTREVGVMLVVTLVGFSALILLIVTSFFIRIPGLNIIIGLVGSLLLSMYLFYDVQTIMGGRTIELSPDEIVFGAITLYVDIILMFKYILLFGNVE